MKTRIWSEGKVDWMDRYFTRTYYVPVLNPINVLRNSVGAGNLVGLRSRPDGRLVKVKTIMEMEFCNRTQ